MNYPFVRPYVLQDELFDTWKYFFKTRLFLGRIGVQLALSS